MKKNLFLLAALTIFASPLLHAADVPGVLTMEQAQAFHIHPLLTTIGNVLLFAAIGIAAAIIGYKVFDKCTPGDLHREIIEHKNAAAAIVAAAVIIGVSIIIAAAMIG